MSTSTLTTHHPPTSTTTVQTTMLDAVEERELDRRLRGALARLRALRVARRERLRAQARREHEQLTERALLASGLQHLR